MTETVVDKIIAAQKAPAQQEPKEEELAICPCCGQKTLHKPVTPDQELTDHFLSCMLTGTPYAKDYELYGGKLVVNVSQVTSELSTKVEHVCTILDNWDKQLADSKAPIQIIKDAVRIFACIPKVQLKTAVGSVLLPSDQIMLICGKVETYHNKRLEQANTDEYLKNCVSELLAMASDTTVLSAVPKDVLMSLIQIHANLYTILVDSGFDANFWERIKLA